MSNKVLILIVVIILVVAGAAAAVYQRNRSKQALKGLTMQDVAPLPQQQEPQQPQPSAPIPAECVRGFDQNTLKTAQVNIKNRQVQISVKNFGKVTVALYDQDAPKTVENFLRLVNAGYYNCLTFHRVAKGFVIQGGDPTGTGSGGESAFGGEFADELNPNTASFKAGYVKGVLAMANRGPNTNTSQFFIVLADAQLPHNYTIFGKVVAGQDVVDKIGQVEVTPELGANDGKPVTPVVMEKVTIIK